MIQISQIKLPCGHGTDALEHKIRKLLRIKGGKITYKITRHSIDARKKPELFDIYTVVIDTGRPLSDDRKEVRRLRNRNITAAEPVRYRFPPTTAGSPPLKNRPVVIGSGPAGLFCALMLAQHGYRPLVLERGKRMEERSRDVEKFWKSGKLNPSSNVQFGEGGAGTFSDGKLNTAVHDKNGRQGVVLKTFVRCGAPENILYESHPHIGTDRLRTVIPNLRRRIEEAGGEFRFETKVTGIVRKDGCAAGVLYESGSGEKKTGQIFSDCIVLAPGHSARDTIEELFSEHVPMEQKNFAVGLRVSHPQSLINQSRYGTADPAVMEKLHLEPANYKVTARASSGRGVYSFCMCPGGYIVNASSEEGMTAVNGMSESARSGSRANSAVVITVGQKEFGSDHPLAGMKFQRELEKKSWQIGGGAVPYEWYSDFAAGKISEDHPCSSPQELCIRGQAVQAPLHELLSPDLNRDFMEGMRHFDHIIPGFAGEEAFVAGIESRTSSPVRILRDSATFQSALRGLYPCGEGAGYAGGIMSAAMDGIKVAEAIGKNFLPPVKTSDKDQGQEKRQLRGRILSLRDAMTPQERALCSDRIAAQVMALTQMDTAGCVLCYKSFKSEVDTAKLIDACVRRGKTVFLPRIVQDERGRKTMKFYRFTGWDALVPGTWGIMEPRENPALELDTDVAGARERLAILPGTVFDRNCGRMGYGGGFYDRFLSKHPEIFTCAVGFSCQIAESVPMGRFDLRPDMVITEKNIYRKQERG